MKNKKKRKIYPKIRLAGDPILETICTPVGDEDISHIIKDMMYILIGSKGGVGISANQAGHSKRIIIVKDKGTFVVMINPEIIDQHGEDCWEEGCLSYPKKTKWIKRAWMIDLKYINELGNLVEGAVIRFPARIIQHEVDHLNGECKVGEE